MSPKLRTRQVPGIESYLSWRSVMRGCHVGATLPTSTLAGKKWNRICTAAEPTNAITQPSAIDPHVRSPLRTLPSFSARSIGPTSLFVHHCESRIAHVDDPEADLHHDQAHQ